MLTRVKTVKMRLIAGIGNTHPLMKSAILKGWSPPVVEINDEGEIIATPSLREQLEKSVAVGNDG